MNWQQYSDTIELMADKLQLQAAYKELKLLKWLVLFCRLDEKLAATRELVLAANNSMQFNQKNEMLKRISGQAFYNTSRFTLLSAVRDSNNFKQNLQEYINGFSEEVRQIIKGTELAADVNELADGELLLAMTEELSGLEWSEKAVGDDAMGRLYDELLYRDKDEQPESKILIEIEAAMLIDKWSEMPEWFADGVIVYDACLENAETLLAVGEQLKKRFAASPLVSGQTASEKKLAVSGIRLMMHGYDAELVKQGDCLGNNLLEQQMDFILSTVPQEKDWQGVSAEIIREYETLGQNGRFGIGLPDYCDSQLLYVQHIVHKLKKRDYGGGRAGIILSSKALCRGTAGSGEAEIRKWLIRNDWLEAIAALPVRSNESKQYLWIIDTAKTGRRQGMVQLIDGASLWYSSDSTMAEKKDQLLQTYHSCSDGDYSRMLSTRELGYQQVTLLRPYKRNYCVNAQRLMKVMELAEVKQSLDDVEKMELIHYLQDIGTRTYKNRDVFRKKLEGQLLLMERYMNPSITARIMEALSVYDETAEPVKNRQGRLEADPLWSDIEHIPLNYDIKEYIEKNVQPFAPEVWVKAGSQKTGYEIHFERYFNVKNRKKSSHTILERIKKLEKRLQSDIGELE